MQFIERSERAARENCGAAWYNHTTPSRRGAHMADWITTVEAAELSGYHPDYIRKLLQAGRIKAQKFGLVWQVSRTSVLAYVRQVEKLGERRGPKRIDET